MRFFLIVWFTCFVCRVACSAYTQVELPLEQLPQEQDYQKTLRSFMDTLSEKDFEVERKEITAVPITDMGELYRLWLLTLHMPNVGCAMLPASGFTLKAIEAKKGLVLPTAPHECQLLAWLASWDFAGNSYRGSKALQLRAFVLAAVDMMMLDYLYQHNPQGANRADYLGGNLIWIGFTYSRIKEALPTETRAAFEAGLKKLASTIQKWGPTGAMTDMDLFAPVGLCYISGAMKDAEVTRISEEYARQLFTNPRYFHPAGYFVDNGCFDTSYNGISLYFGTWAAIMSDWKFAQTAIDKAFRLRAHLSFPDPDGSFSGPSHLTSRCSGDPPHDQWQFPPKTYGSGMVTDEAIYFAPLPSEDNIRAAPTIIVNQLNTQLSKPKEATPSSWKESHWSGVINYAYEFYKKGYYERRLKLAKENSPLLKPLYLRNENFLRPFEKAFVIGRFDGFAAAIHTGPVGGIHGGWQRPYGFGGGELSAFWTPSTGSVMLGRRRGIQGHVYDSFDEWRIWPVHAVTGLTADGDVVTSARIQQPEVETKCSETSADVRVKGVIPKYVAAKKGCVPTDIEYERHFVLNAKGLHITTSLKTPGKEKLAELYETIPVFLRENGSQKMATISFQVGKEWQEATAESRPNVKSVRIDRFNGAVLVTFTKPAQVKLSPQVWTDGFQTQAQCRTLLVDLSKGASGSIDYQISAVPPTKTEGSK
jgi:hypothetical protein